MKKKATAPGTARERKNMDIDVRKLAAARRVLGARSDTETIDLALDLVAFHDEVSSALDRLTRAGGVAEVYRRGTSQSSVLRVSEPRK
ncbi:MAG: hypothetical protein ACREOK_07490 [Gemmatimonadaceae bacterium]